MVCVWVCGIGYVWVGDVNVSVYVRACVGRLACISVFVYELL